MTSTADGRWARLLVKVVLTFATLMFLGLLLPIVLGMARSGGPAGSDGFRLFGLDVATVTTDGDGGFSSTFGPGVVLVPLVAALLVAAAGVFGIARRS
ncbi:hypothetical protein ACPPVT_19985 [Angustibacter sp. McL0619]|uniref:hypothetical protein n=1 Tax=Angustibacter sp. McL0619 TaxID=3415676 RepID=UPI003CE7FD7E